MRFNLSSFRILAKKPILNFANFSGELPSGNPLNDITISKNEENNFASNPLENPPSTLAKSSTEVL